MWLIQLNETIQSLRGTSELSVWIFQFFVTCFWFKIFSFFGFFKSTRSTIGWKRGFFITSFLFGMVIAAPAILMASYLTSSAVSKPASVAPLNMLYQTQTVSPYDLSSPLPEESMSLAALLKQMWLERRQY